MERVCSSMLIRMCTKVTFYKAKKMEKVDTFSVRELSLKESGEMTRKLKAN